MNLRNIPIDESLGAILVHNVVGADGRKALSKGRLVTADDIVTLRGLGRSTVYAAVLDPDDVREDDAAIRLSQTIASQEIEQSKPSGGRVNFYATRQGFFHINSQALHDLNELRGITLATIKNYAPVSPKKMVATLKTIGLALPGSILGEAERIVSREGRVLGVTTVKNQRVAIILVGSENGRKRVQEAFLPPIRGRIEELGAQVVAEDFVAEDESSIANAIDSAVRSGAQMIMLAGETSIMDSEDITPRGIQRATGQVELYGAPVEPGNLILLAYRGAVPIVGAPGCVKSRETNVVDLILPRLLIGERVTRADVNRLAEGGLLV
jgi:molybdenum cofactor cytidylyltransferase